MMRKCKHKARNIVVSKERVGYFIVGCKRCRKLEFVADLSESKLYVRKEKPTTRKKVWCWKHKMWRTDMGWYYKYTLFHRGNILKKYRLKLDFCS